MKKQGGLSHLKATSGQFLNMNKEDKIPSINIQKGIKTLKITI